MASASCTRLFSRVIWCAVLAAGSLLSQDSPPDQPFQAVHLLWVDMQKPDAEKTVQTAVAQMNQAIVKAGCADCVYHLWKVVDGGQSGNYNYVQISNWPGRAIYDRVHNSPEYLTASKNWPDLRSVVTREVYNRYVEVLPGK